MANNPWTWENETTELPRLNIYWLNVLNMSIGWFILFCLLGIPQLLKSIEGFGGWNGGKRSQGMSPRNYPPEKVTYPTKREKENTIFKKCLSKGYVTPSWK